MPRLRDESGFTLIETLLAASLGIVILFGAGGLLQLATTSQKRTSGRIEAVQRGRLTMELMTRQLRSQVCLGQGIPSLQVAESDVVTFYGSLSTAPVTPGQVQVDKRTLRFEPLTAGSDEGRIVEEVHRGVGTRLADATFPVAPDTTRVLVDKVSRPAPGAPIFRFQKYDAPNSPNMTELAQPVSAADRAITVRVDVAFEAYPDAGGDSNLRTVYADQAFVRTADPTDPEHSPKCI